MNQGTRRLDVQGLTLERNDHTLFSDLIFSVQAGDILQIEGPNGSGKTTLLRVLCGLLPCSSGEVRWCGEPIRDIYPEFAGEVAYVGHRDGVKAELSALENLRVARTMGRPRPGVEPEHVLERLELPLDREDVPCRELSAGQRRRVALGRLLITDACLWVLDEPFTALDRSGRALVEELLAENARRGGLAVLSTHHVMQLGGCAVDPLSLG